MSGPGQSVLRQAVESLLRARADAERDLHEVSARVAQSTRRPCEAARAAPHPLARRAADDAAGHAAAMPAELTALATATRMAIATEVHALLDLLAVGHHHLDPLPPLDIARLRVAGDPAFLSAFSDGFARSYIATVLGDLSRGRATSKADAAAHPLTEQADIDAARDRIVAAVAPEHRDLVRTWLSHPDCHAVEVHGPQVGDRDLELRAGWTHPPDHGTDGADSWRIRDDGKVVSKHAAGPGATRFNSPEAFARPLDVLLAAAAQRPGGIDELFADHAFGGRVAIFIAAERAGLTAGDTFGYRGAGTSTAEAATDWVKVRGMAMKKDDECLPPAHTLAYDPTSHGPDPGVRLVFADGDDGWTMITYYAAGSPGHDNKRLEDIA